MVDVETSAVAGLLVGAAEGGVVAGAAVGGTAGVGCGVGSPAGAVAFAPAASVGAAVGKRDGTADGEDGATTLRASDSTCARHHSALPAGAEVGPAEGAAGGGSAGARGADIAQVSQAVAHSSLPEGARDGAGEGDHVGTLDGDASTGANYLARSRARGAEACMYPRERKTALRRVSVLAPPTERLQQAATTYCKGEEGQSVLSVALRT